MPPANWCPTFAPRTTQGGAAQGPAEADRRGERAVGELTVHAANVDCAPKIWPESLGLAEQELFGALALKIKTRCYASTDEIIGPHKGE